MDLTPIRTEKTQFNRKYRRLDKPPYTYVAMTTLAIQVRISSPASGYPCPPYHLIEPYTYLGSL